MNLEPKFVNAEFTKGVSMADNGTVSIIGVTECMHMGSHVPNYADVDRVLVILYMWRSIISKRTKLMDVLQRST